MKREPGILAINAMMLAATVAAYGQDKPAKVDASATKAPAPSAGLLNDWLRQQSDVFAPWNLGGQIRLRFEHREYFGATGVAGAGTATGDFRRVGGDRDNSFLDTRVLFHLGYTPTKWVTAYVEGRSSGSTGDERNPNPDSDYLDLHQAYLGLGDAKEFPITARIGRQELSYGDERLIGISDWSNTRRVFDAAKIRYENKDVWVDGFVSRVIIPDDNNFNLSNDYDWFSGVYASTKTLIPRQETQLYFLARNTGLGSPATIGAAPAPQGASPRDIYTVGARVKSLPGEFKGWDYGAELAYQFGHFKETTAGAPAAVAGKNLDQQAFAAYLGGGYTWKDVYATPRLGLEYNFSSGDANATDGTHGTFDNLFPTNHKFYGNMDFFSLQNVHNVRFMSSAKPCKSVTLTADYHLFWLADTHDSFYTISGARRGGLAATPGTGYGINPGYSGYVGSEIDLIATWTINASTLLQAGYGHFFTGSYVDSSLAALGGSKDANWIYAQFTFNF